MTSVPHGSRSRYNYGCRCEPCREANREYGREYWQVSKKYYPFIPDVPVDRALAHIERLRASGMGCGAIARAAGVEKETVAKIVRGQRARGIRPDTERRILAVELDPSWVDATGTRRRLQALAALGHTSRTIADVAGFTHRTVSAICCGQATVTKETAAAVRSAYDTLSMTVGTSTITRDRARRAGWAPPLAWDDDAIDDPAANPVGMGSGHAGADDRLDEWVRLVRTGEDPERAARRVGWGGGMKTVLHVAHRLGRAGEVTGHAREVAA